MHNGDGQEEDDEDLDVDERAGRARLPRPILPLAGGLALPN